MSKAKNKEIEAAELRGMAKAFRGSMTPWNVGEPSRDLPASSLMWIRWQANQAEEKANEILKSEGRTCSNCVHAHLDHPSRCWMEMMNLIHPEEGTDCDSWSRKNG
jgi:hypothetical protein